MSNKYELISGRWGFQVASGLLKLLLPGPLTITPALGAGTTQVQGVFIEAFITAALVLSVLFLACEKHKSTFLAPVGIGLTLLAGHLFVSFFFPHYVMAPFRPC